MTPDQHPGRLWKRERIRLDLCTYAQDGETWLVTITTLVREKQHLANPATADAVCSSLATAHKLNRCTLLAYCVMPDHLHAVTQVCVDGDLIKLVNGFKSYSTRAWWGVGGAGTLWQRSFHDRGLQTAADVEAAAPYVWENPIRSGLVEVGDRFPYVGGELFQGP